jgi:homoserine kinase
MLTYLNAEFGAEIELHKKMPIGSGLGSSAASAVASVFALNQLLAQKLPDKLLLKFAIEGEKIASGSNVHLDNISACLYGGFVLVRGREPIDIVKLDVPKDLHCVIIHPRIEIKTAETRKILPDHVPLNAAISQWANVAGVVSALFKNDYELLGRSLEDNIIEQDRSVLIPHFLEMKAEALKRGAIGFGISGSGPSVFALTDKWVKAKDIASNTGGVLYQYNVGLINRDHGLYICRPLGEERKEKREKRRAKSVKRGA